MYDEIFLGKKCSTETWINFINLVLFLNDKRLLEIYFQCIYNKLIFEIIA